jgi:hypothetical protein
MDKYKLLTWHILMIALIEAEQWMPDNGSLNTAWDLEVRETFAYEQACLWRDGVRDERISDFTFLTLADCRNVNSAYIWLRDNHDIIQ